MVSGNWDFSYIKNYIDSQKTSDNYKGENNIMKYRYITARRHHIMASKTHCTGNNIYNYYADNNILF